MRTYHDDEPERLDPALGFDYICTSHGPVEPDHEHTTITNLIQRLFGRRS